MITYTTILHQARDELGLSLNEYALADIIYQLQNNPTSEHKGWCYSSKKYLGKCIGVSEQAVHGILNKLYESGLLEKQEETKHIRATDKWYRCVVLMKESMNAKESLAILKKVESDTKETLVGNTKESLVNNNKRDNNKINIESISYLEDIPIRDIEEFTTKFNISERQLKEKAEELADYCRAKGKKYKDYKAFLRNAVRKEYKVRRVEKKPWENIPELPDEVKAGNIERMQKLKEGIGI